jgi:AraC-like DNA-binding protein/mannose-6-phosphate isomerase-like protein (cupin superfamily)
MNALQNTLQLRRKYVVGGARMEIRIGRSDCVYTIDHLTTNLMENRLEKRTQLHKHPVFHIMYILKGKGRFTVGSTTTVAMPGMLYIINPNEPHGFLFGDGEPLSNLESTFRLLDTQGEATEVHFFDMMKEFGNLRIPPEMRSQPFIVPERLKPMLTEGFSRLLVLYDSPLLRNHFSVMVADLLVRVETVVMNAIRAEENHNPGEAAVESIKHFLYTNRHRPVTLKETADFVHLTPNYLCRLFKEHTRETPMGYLQGIRMREAESLLSLTDLPVFTIADKLGYEEPSYFARVFRSVYGVSPVAYRKQLLAGDRIK